MAAACSSDSDATPGADAGDETFQRETGLPPTPDSAPQCDPNADLFAKVKSQSIGGGSSTTTACVKCIKQKCPEAVAACTKDCTCQRIVGNNAECYIVTQQIGCFADLATVTVREETRKYALQVGGCAQTECTEPCAADAGGTTPFDAGADTGADVATE